MVTRAGRAKFTVKNSQEREILQGHVVEGQGGVALNSKRIDLDSTLGRNSLL